MSEQMSHKAELLEPRLFYGWFVVAAGFAFDVTLSYTLPIVASIGANVIAAVIMAATSRPEQR
jgi:hypothetical protein